MDMLTKNIAKFAKQKGVVKDSIAEDVFKDTDVRRIDDDVLYRIEKRMIMYIYDDIGFICKWKNDRTIMIYRVEQEEDKQSKDPYIKPEKKHIYNVKLINKDRVSKLFYVETSPIISEFSMALDFIDIQNIIEYTSQFHKRLKSFVF